MNKKLFTYVLVLFWAMGIMHSNAQTDPCISKLNDAGRLINDGRYDEGIELLRSTIESCSLSSNDKIEAYKTLIIAYFEIDQLEMAEECALNVLRINPKYRTNKLRDPVEMVELFEKFRPTPILRLGVIGGINSTMVTADNTYSVATSDDASGLANYASEMGFQIGLQSQYRIWRSLWVNAGLVYRNNRYLNTLNNIQGRDINYTESLTWFDLPVSAQYEFLEGNVRPYLLGGVQFSFLNSALGELSRDDLSDLVNRDEQRKSSMIGILAGAGLSYQYKSILFNAELRYINQPGYVNEDGTRFLNLESIFRYYYLDNDFTMDLLQVNLSIHYPIVFKNVKTR